MSEATPYVPAQKYKTLQIECYDACTLGRSCMNNLEALFTAIAAASKQKSTVHELAAIGQYIAMDWANTFDCMAEDHKEVAP